MLGVGLSMDIGIIKHLNNNYWKKLKIKRNKTYLSQTMGLASFGPTLRAMSLLLLEGGWSWRDGGGSTESGEHDAIAFFGPTFHAMSSSLSRWWVRAQFSELILKRSLITIEKRLRTKKHT
jgi:hypothetical protein